MTIILHFNQESDDMDKKAEFRDKVLYLGCIIFIRIIFIPYPDKRS